MKKVQNKKKKNFPRVKVKNEDIKHLKNKSENSSNFNKEVQPYIIIKMFDTHLGIYMEDWFDLFTKSIAVKEFRSRIPYLRIFEKMLSKISKLYSGSKLTDFFVQLMCSLKEIDIFVIPLFFEWCYILYKQKLKFSKNLIRENIRYEILKSSLIGMISGDFRNYLILLLSCDIDTCMKYLFPNSHIKHWIQEFEEDYFDQNLYIIHDFWKFSLDILRTLNEEILINNNPIKLNLIEKICYCKIESWGIENWNKIDIESLKIRRAYFDNAKLLLLLLNSFLNSMPYTMEFFSLNINLMLRINIENFKKKNSRIKNDSFENCLCKSDIISSLNSPDILLDFIIYIIITWIMTYYGIEDDLIDEFGVLYEESFNILYYLTSNGQRNNSFYIYNASIQIENMKKIFFHFKKYPFFRLNLHENDTYCSKTNQPHVNLIIDSILNIYKTNNSKYVTEKNLKENQVTEEILITLLFLVLLHPNTSDNTIFYLLDNIYKELYSFGFLLIGSCMALLYKKDIFPNQISKRIQLNILNFRSIHFINSQNFPYIQFLHCAYHLISRSYQNYKIINMIFQLFEGNFLQYFKTSDNNNIGFNQEDLRLSINISLTLTSVYMKLLEFFYLNPSLCKLFFEMKLNNKLSGGDINCPNIKEYDTKLKYNQKISLLDVFNKLTTTNELKNLENKKEIFPKEIDQKYEYFNEYQEFNFASMNYSVILHIISIIYIPIIKRANMSLYAFKYSILPSVNFEKDICFEDDNSNINFIQQKIDIPKQFCIEFLDEVVKYCKKFNQKSPFEVDRFTSKLLINCFDVKSNFLNILSLIHTCNNNKNDEKSCFLCSIDSYAEYLGIINTLKHDNEEGYFIYCITKSWINHTIIVSIATILNIYVNINEDDRFNDSEVNTIFEFSNNSYDFLNYNINYELLIQLIYFLFYEIKDDSMISKESGDIQRTTFRSLIIYLTAFMLKSKIGREILLEIDLKHLVMRLCHLFAFRIECLATNIHNSNITNLKHDSSKLNDFNSTPMNRYSSDNLYSVDQTNEEVCTPTPLNSKYVSDLSTPIKKKRITPIIVSRSHSLNRSLKNDLNPLSLNLNASNTTKLALREETQSYSCLFHLKIIITAINNIKDLYLITETKEINKSEQIEKTNFEVQNFILNVIEDSLFFLLPSNTLSKRSILNYSNETEIEIEKTNQYLATICEAEEISETEEIENLQDNEGQKFSFNNSNILKSMNIPCILNDEDFSKEWYIEIVISLIRYLFNNIESIKDISSLITDVASRMTLWNRKDNKEIIFNVCIEIIKFSHNYFYNELPEISLCLLRNDGMQLLPSIKFVFVAILDQNSLLIDNINELPSINALNELKLLHDTISIFYELLEVLELCFQIIMKKGNIFSLKDNDWLRHSLNLIDRGMDALSTELLKMERIIIPPKFSINEEFIDENITYQDNYLEQYKYNTSNSLWNTYIKNCKVLLKECAYIHTLFSNNWIDPNTQTCFNLENNNKSNIKETDSDLNNFITFEQCDEGILQENESYSDIKLTPHWNTFIKSLFL